MTMTLQSKALENLTQMIEAELKGEEILAPRNNVQLKFSLRQVADRAISLCNGTKGNEVERVHGTAYVMFRKAWDNAYNEPKPMKNQGFDSPPPTKRG